MRRRETGQAQARYYPRDRLATLRECYPFDPWRRDEPVGDLAPTALWRGFEGERRARFPEAARVATPAWEDIDERPAWRAFLSPRGDAPGPPGVFVKARRRPGHATLPSVKG